jgi:ABC-type transport system substrate-binding protein
LRVAVGSLGEETFYTPDGISPILSGPYDMPLAIPREGEGDLKLLPGLVESWELTDNARTLTLTLKSGMKWHDGEKVTADDLVSHANRVRDPEATGSGAPEWADLISDVEKVDDLTVRLKGTAAFAAFSFQLSFAMGIREALVTPEHVTKDSLKNEPVGTGPWKFASHTRGVSITFDAVDEDFQLAGGRVRPQFDSMTLIRAPEASTRVAMLKTGAADVAELNWPTAKQVQVDPNIRILSIPGAEYLMMGFLGLTSSSRSGSIAGFADSPQGWPAGLPNTDILEVREAMMKAIDFNKLNDLFYGGLAEPTPFYRSTKASIIYDATDMRFHIPFIEPDLNAARQLMADAGFPITCEVKPRRPDRPEGATFEDCTGGWKQPLWVPTTSGSYGTTMLDVAAIIADDWARIGLETELKPMDFNTFRFRYFSNMDPHNPDGWGHAFLGISSGDPVPSVASRFKRGQGRNQMFLSDEFEALFAIEDAAETFDELKAAKVASNYETAKVFAESAILLHGLPIGAVEGITGWKPYPGNPDARGHNFESIAHS